MGDKKTRIGLMADFLSSEYSDNLIRGITTYCIENDLELLLFPIGDLTKNHPNHDNYQFSAITSQINIENLDGIIVTSGTLMHGVTKDSFFNYLKSFKPLKIVNIASQFPGIPSIEVDCKQAFDALIQYLIDEQGCRKFGFMGVESQSSEVALRTQIFKDVLTRNGISLDDTIFWKSNFEYASAYKQLTDYRRQYLKFDLDAVIALNDDTAYACMDFFTKRMGMNVPKDIIITGFDNLQRASFSNPTLTSVNQQIEYLGYQAARTLHQSLRGKKVPDYQTIRAKAVLRQSTCRNKIKQEDFVGNSYISMDLRTSKDFSNSFSVSEWFTRRSQILQAANYYASAISNQTLDEIGATLTNGLRTFGFQAAAVIAYDEPIEMSRDFECFPLPRRARLLAGFDYEKLFNTINFKEPYYFNPHEGLIPEEFLKFPGCGTIVTSLFVGTCHYGYLLLRMNNYDAGVYELVQRSISNQLQVAYNYTKVYEQQSQMQSENKQLDIIAHTDELTGLRNRRGFLDLGQAALNLSEEMNQTGLVVYCDMDGLKKINDTYGHESGDVAIKAQAQILNKVFRANDIIGRLGGDEFAVICPGLSEEKLKTIQNHINKACKEWKKDTKSKFDLSISMGFIKYPNETAGYKMEVLLSMADNYLYMEKRNKKVKGKLSTLINNTIS